MYQCSFFYASDRILPQNQDAVVAAWSVTADRAYRYDLENDPMDMPNVYCLIRTTAGAGTVETADGVLRLLADSVVILPRAQILKYRAMQPVWQYEWVDFISCQKNLPCGKLKTVPRTDQEAALFRELLRVGETYPYEVLYIYSIFVQYCYTLYLTGTESPAHNAPKILYAEICDYIGQKLYSRLTVQEIADFFGVSARRVHQIFRENADCSPKQYIMRQKTEKAQQLLRETAASVTDIAELLGFNSAYHFSASFKQQTGDAPYVYRRKGQRTGKT